MFGKYNVCVIGILNERDLIKINIIMKIKIKAE
jgi:hypothetical protein